MRRSGQRATCSELVPITPDHSELLVLELDARGRLADFQLVRATLLGEAPEAAEARRLCEQLRAKLARAGSLAELHARARLALDLIENLVALEEMHGAEARRLLAPAPVEPR